MPTPKKRDWFAENAPQQDWFAANAPTQASQPTPATAPEKKWYQMSPNEFLQKRIGDLEQEAQRHHNLAMGPESVGKPWYKRAGHSLAALIPETAQMVDKTLLGMNEWKNVPVIAAGVVDPAIPAAYFMTQGAKGTVEGGQNIVQGKATPSDVQDTLMSASMVAGGPAASMSPKSGNAMQAPRMIGQGARKVGQAVAPRLAETAIGIQTRDRLHGRRPGQAALRETKANNPAELAVEAQDKAASLTKELETVAAQSEAPASVGQAVQMLNEEAVRAAKQNNPELLKQVNQLKNRMTMDLNGQPFPKVTTPEQILALKRGVDDLIASWGPRESTAPIEGIRHRLYGILDAELERTVPEARDLNPRIGDMITVAKRAELKAAAPDTMQKVINRVGVHTGAAATAIGGGLAFGPVGAVAGFILPELATNPVVQMKVARWLAGEQVKLTPKEIGQLPPRVAVQYIGGKRGPSGSGSSGASASLTPSEALKDLQSTYGVTESHLKQAVESAEPGLKYMGLWDTSVSRNGLQAFVQDPKTGTMFNIRVDAILNPEEFGKVLREKRWHFANPQIQPGLQFQN